MKKLSAFLFFAILLAGVAGCQSPQEKRGISRLPQNQPQAWESKPYGDMKM